MDHQEAKRVAYHISIQNIQGFGLAETQKFGFYSAAVVSRTDSDSVVEVQNSVSSKLLVGWGCMGNG
jgi:hypothetical protein